MGQDDLEIQKIIDQYNNRKQWTKNQHYVPQFYLKKFTKQNWKIEVLDLANKRILKEQSVEHICSGDYFYSVKDGEKHVVSQIIEDLFNYYENKFSDIYFELVDNISNYKEIEDKLIYELSEFVTISRLRGEYFKNHMKNSQAEMTKKMMQMSYNMIKEHNPKDERIIKIAEDKDLEKKLIEWDFNIIKDNSDIIRFITDQDTITKFTQLFFSKKIRIYISNWERNFVTSDCCVVELFPEIKTPFWIDFYERYHYFVLSPRILIEFINPLYPWKRLKRKVISGWDVIFYNYLRSMYSRYLYSISKDDFIEQDYNKTTFNYIDCLYELFPSKYRYLKDKIESYSLIAKKMWLKFNSNFELYHGIRKLIFLEKE